MTDSNLLPDAFPWPREWRSRQRAKYVLFVAFFGLFGCICVAAGVSIFLPGFHDDRAYLLVLGAPLLFGLAAIGFFSRVRVRGRPTTAVRLATIDEPALVIPYSRGLATTYVLVCATTLALLLVIGVVSALVGGTGIVVAVVCLGFVGYLGWTVAEMARHKLRAGAIALTPQGVRHRSWTFDSYLPWDQVVSVSAGLLDGQLITLAAFDNVHPMFHRRSRLWRQPEYRLAPHTAIRGMYLAVDPALALHTLRFYHENPAARVELGTDAAVRRVRSDD
jgi:hypothetical protein